MKFLINLINPILFLKQYVMLRATALTKLADFVDLNSPIYRCVVYSSLNSSKHWFRNGPSSRDAPLGDRAREQLTSFSQVITQHNLERLEGKRLPSGLKS